MVDALLCSNSNPLATNLNGDNCFHVAAQQGDGHTLHHLCRWMRQTNTKSSELDKSNHAGMVYIVIRAIVTYSETVYGHHFQKEVTMTGV